VAIFRLLTLLLLHQVALLKLKHECYYISFRVLPEARPLAGSHPFTCVILCCIPGLIKPNLVKGGFEKGGGKIRSTWVILVAANKLLVVW